MEMTGIKFYSLHIDGTAEKLGHAHAVNSEYDAKLLSGDALDATLSRNEVIPDWTPLELVWGFGAPVDYLPSTPLLRICSNRLKTVIDETRSGRESIQWLDVTVQAAGSVYRYFILHFIDCPDVLDRTRSILVDDDFVVKPVIDGSLVNGLDLVSFPGDTLGLIISERIKRAIEASGCTGLEFSPTPVS